MRLACLAIAAILNLEAGIIHGVVIERTTQRALARSRVRLQLPLAGGGLRTVAESMVSRNGTFMFPSLADGQYLLTATRAGYLDARYGQTRPSGPGKLISVQGDSSAFAEIRMYRLGGIAGRVYDENAVGLADVTVIAYPARLPLRMEASARSDDRGVFRIGRLKPGRYWVRTAPAELEDRTGVLPTFYPFSRGTEDAKAVTVEADRDETDVEIQPFPGRLFSIHGAVQRCPSDSGSARLTLSSDTGVLETVAPCEGPFKFEGLAPNNYELHAEPVNSRRNVAAFTERFIDQFTRIDMVMAEFPHVSVRITGTEGQRLEASAVPVTVRRKRLDGGAPQRSIWDPLGPGYWEVYVTPPESSYFAALDTSPGRMRGSRATPLDLAPEMRLDPEAWVHIDVRISNKAGSVEGAVKSEGNPVVAAPVFLFPVDPDVRRRMHGPRTAYTGQGGEFRFSGVAPGRYLIAASWDLDEIDEQSLTQARAPSLSLGASQRETVSLTLWERR